MLTLAMDSNYQTIVILDNVRSAFNVGAIFRTCDATASIIYLVGITPRPPLDKLIKTSVKSIDFVKWEYFKTIDEAIEKAKQDGFRIICVEQSDKSKRYTDTKLNGEKQALIFGHEIVGVSKSAIDLSDEIVDLPMYGKKNSLNIATTVGIVLYERIRQLNQ